MFDKSPNSATNHYIDTLQTFRNINSQRNYLYPISLNQAEININYNNDSKIFNNKNKNNKPIDENEYYYGQEEEQEDAKAELK